MHAPPGCDGRSSSYDDDELLAYPASASIQREGEGSSIVDRLGAFFFNLYREKMEGTILHHQIRVDDRPLLDSKSRTMRRPPGTAMMIRGHSSVHASELWRLIEALSVRSGKGAGSGACELS